MYYGYTHKTHTQDVCVCNTRVCTDRGGTDECVYRVGRSVGSSLTRGEKATEFSVGGVPGTARGMLRVLRAGRRRLRWWCRRITPLFCRRRRRRRTRRAHDDGGSERASYSEPSESEIAHTHKTWPPRRRGVHHAHTHPNRGPINIICTRYSRVCVRVRYYYNIVCVRARARSLALLYDL